MDMTKNTPDEFLPVEDCAEFFGGISDEAGAAAAERETNQLFFESGPTPEHIESWLAEQRQRLIEFLGIDYWKLRHRLAHEGIADNVGNVQLGQAAA
jgi:hypothetical protein